MKAGQFEVVDNVELAARTWRLRLAGDHGFTAPGQFANLAVDGCYLRRPLSVCDSGLNWFTLIYKLVGPGTRALAAYRPGRMIDALTGLGNGFTALGERPLLLGGGVGVPPLYGLAKAFRQAGREVAVGLGFGRDDEVILVDDFAALDCRVEVVTVEPGRYATGLVTDVLPTLAGADRYFACGPVPMLRALTATLTIPGQLCLETPMACGFGACRGCGWPTTTGLKRLCADGPVLDSQEVIWPTPA